MLKTQTRSISLFYKMTGLHFLTSFVIAISLLYVGVGLEDTFGLDLGGSKLDGWDHAHATFYGDIHGNETMQGACGYGDLFKQGYGLQTTALSTALFNNGATCGACFEIMCVNDPQWCKPGTIKVTATNFCPANYSKIHDIWCNPPQKHFDLSLPMFLAIAQYKAGIVPVAFRRVVCSKIGGVKFEINWKSNPYWLLVLVYNVGGVGTVADVKIKGMNPNWLQMKRNWGQNWEIGTNLVGQGLSFQVTLSDGKTIIFYNVAPSNWGVGRSYDGGKNF